MPIAALLSILGYVEIALRLSGAARQVIAEIERDRALIQSIMAEGRDPTPAERTTLSATSPPSKRRSPPRPDRATTSAGHRRPAGPRDRPDPAAANDMRKLRTIPVTFTPFGHAREPGHPARSRGYGRAGTLTS